MEWQDPRHMYTFLMGLLDRIEGAKPKKLALFSRWSALVPAHPHSDQMANFDGYLGNGGISFLTAEEVQAF